MTPGTHLLGGRYEIAELIGRGGMAEVHLGYDTRLSRPVAVKMLRSDLARDPSFLARFRREAQSAAGLNHASIVSVYDSGEDHFAESGGARVDIPYIVMEYVEGQTLRELLNKQHQVEPAEAARITEAILDALAYSHRMGIVHRDIKPANVMITSSGSIKVMDFGIARAIADTQATMTHTHAVIGTAQYLSPEQAQGQHVDTRSDLYSTGCLLFELLTGRPPFSGDSPVSIAYQHVSEPPPRPSSLNPEVSDDLDAVVLHALAKKREDRYQDATAFRVDLQAARLGRPISDAARASGGAVAAATMLMSTPGAAPTTVLGAQGAGADRTGSQGTAAAHRHGNTGSLPPVGRDPDEEPPKRRGPAYALLALAVIAVLALAWFAGKSLLDHQQATPQQVSVPSVVGKPKAVAEAKVRAAGLVPQSGGVTSDKPADTVVSESPDVGQRVAKGSTVTLSVSTGPGQASVPDVTGYDESEARAALTQVGLTVGATKQVNNTSFPKGKVVSTDPPKGSYVAANSAVTLNISTGKVTVPDELGKNAAEANTDLSGLGFRTKTTYQPSDQAEGTVLKQSSVGRLIDYGSTIELVVAQPKPTTPTTTTSTSTTAPTTAPTTATTTAPTTATTTAPTTTAPTTATTTAPTTATTTAPKPPTTATTPPPR